MNNTDLTYAFETNLDPEEFREILVASTLGDRRPIHEISRLSAMCRHANLIISARDNGKMVGIARALTDFGFCTYLSDLAVHQQYQRRGIGKELIKRIKEAAPQANLILLAAPAAVDYYPKIGMSPHPAAFILKNIADLK